jgi:hypothetical protein
MQFNNLSKSPMKRIKYRYYAFITSGVLSEDIKTNGKEHQRRCNTLDDAVVAEF